MFYGETAINLDAKGRLAVPVRYREMLVDACQNQLVLTYNPFEISSLWLFPKSEWQKVHDSVMALSTFDVKHRNMQFKLVGSAYHTEPDKGSRVQLPANMRQVASMDKKVVMLGMGNKFEIWNDEALMQLRQQIPDLSEGVSDEMKALVL
ncbi:Cell division protein MraZ [hydrothermal vent metagenome]|uniref:Transcriptional regulator MraZ n=1 Tax=hydrothermal vent metagenome TaxID=652676 RepID=A0A3B0VCR2_9ZZZZ